MADENNTTPIQIKSEDIDATTESMRQQGSVGERVSNIFSNQNKIFELVGQSLNNLSSTVNISKEHLRNLSDPTSAINSQFGLLATSALGATDSFKNLASVDTKSLTTYSDQLKGLLDILKSPGSFSGAVVEEATSALSRALSGIGVDKNKLTSEMAKGATSFAIFASNVLKSADNGLRLQNALLQLTSSTGDFGELIQDAGQDLSNMNQLLARQSMLISDANKDTNLGTDVLEDYWAELAKIPNILKEINVELPGSSKSINVLSAAIQMSIGSGRQYKDVLSDLKVATIEFGLSTSEAFKFTSKISELSNKLKAPLEDVRNNILNTTKAFKGFADAGDASAKQSESIANIMNRYGESLKNTGMTAQASVNLISQMTSSITNLTVAQKAFLSQQSGGPGGLRGAFNIENMLRKGETDKVFEMVKTQMQKQFGGKIVSLEEATKSDNAASQLQKQMLMLQKGPLAQFAKTDQEAYRVLEAFKNNEKGKGMVSDLSQTAASDQINKGKQIQDLSRTSFGGLKTTLENTRFTANIANFESMQKVFSAGVGTIVKDTDAQKKMRDSIKSTTSETDKFTSIGKNAASNIDDVQKTASGFKTFVNSTVDGFKQMVGLDKNKKTDFEQKKVLSEEIKASKATIKPTFEPSKFSSLNEKTFGEQETAPTMVKNAVKINANNVATPQPILTNQVATKDIKEASENFNVKLNVEAICSHCKNSLEISEQAKSVNPTIGSK